MASEIAAFEAELKEYREQLSTVESTLRADPDNAELQTLKAELEEVISLTETTIAELRPAPAAAAQAAAPEPDKAKWSRDNHPAFQPGYRKPGAANAATPADNVPSAPVSYKVNDMVMAKWLSGDKAFYPARITSITGSAAAPVYYVTFKSYNTTESLRGSDIRPISQNSSGSNNNNTATTNSATSTSNNAAQKRRADGTPVSHQPDEPAGPAHAPAAPGVISAAADINQELAQLAKKEPSRVGDGPPRPAKIPRKVKANKELEAGKNKWQEFASKGKFGKGVKKDSMFRTGEGVNARVGFTGSGQAMRKDTARTRHIYQLDEDDG